MVNNLISRWLVFSISSILTGLAIMYAETHWAWMLLLWVQVTFLTMGAALRFRDAWFKLYMGLMLDGRAFWSDHIPQLVVMPWALYLSMQKEYWLVAGIIVSHWCMSLYSMLVLKRWKEHLDG